MELVLVFVALATVNAEPVQRNITLDEFFFERYQMHIHEWSLKALEDYRKYDYREMNSIYGRLSWKATPLPLMKEVLQYTNAFTNFVAFEFATELENLTVQSIYKDLNEHCSEYLETPIVERKVEPRITTCVMIRLGKCLTLKLKRVMEVGLQQLSRRCVQRQMALCSAVNSTCALAYEEQMGQLLSSYIEDQNDAKPVDGLTLLEIIKMFVFKTIIDVSQPFVTANRFLTLMSYFTYSVPSTEPFTFENLIRPWNHKVITPAFFNKDRNTIISQDKLTWGIVRSNTGTVDLPCSYYKDTYSRDSKTFSELLRHCYSAKKLEITVDLMRCAYKDSISKSLAWTTVPSVYFHSQCLCLVYNGTECGVKAPPGVDPQFYCFSVLLRDFQRQVFYRPAVTYLDYALQTRVPVCQFNNLLQIAFSRVCSDFKYYVSLNFVPSVQCYFKDLVNKHLNCTETALITTYNHTVLCNAKNFMQLVLCDYVTEDEVSVPYYGAGDSTLVLVLTYVDVVVRVFTLVTYLACPQLRNLPGKLLIGYQVTALLRLLAVRASVADLAMAVRFDVAMDLATTFWLTAYLHFLTVCINDLRPPDLLRPDEACLVLIRYAMFGWALPAALSAVFFLMDETLDSRLQFGQLAFVLCNYVALFSNLFMLFKNFYFYYDVLSSVHRLQGVTERSIFADLFNFAMKTSLLSGAGITFRLVFTQIQGLENLLGYYHVLGTLQGLLLFALYGCNREARVFWLRVFSSKLHYCHRRENTFL